MAEALTARRKKWTDEGEEIPKLWIFSPPEMTSIRQVFPLREALGSRKYMVEIVYSYQNGDLFIPAHFFIIARRLSGLFSLGSQYS